MKRLLVLACAALLAACSSGADVADDAPANDSTLDAITGRPRGTAENVQEQVDKAQKDADARASDAGADEAP